MEEYQFILDFLVLIIMLFVRKQMMYRLEKQPLKGAYIFMFASAMCELQVILAVIRMIKQ
jgi:hypothetical protein